MAVRSDFVVGILCGVDLGNEILLLGKWAGGNVVRCGEVDLERVVKEAVVDTGVGQNVFLRLTVTTK